MTWQPGIILGGYLEYCQYFIFIELFLRIDATHMS
jgi:hypothetical protein